ncbi:RNA polymerase sigma factor [Planomicrobium sp. CPCC 101110]|uniref:RNA polymerase sigma factor n=1 Tax=Planomicrobium sp. CPCC 101110 TaxID=2599619 RepID=UPI0011B51F4C|nr:RNA polymerase sigma factor [Planomicrobium sp. CPCC 101110]TWT25861.1 RNA polymerase sigma factor [Planomicrobium sp. CPCC 101110]
MNELFIRQKIEAVWRAESAIIVASITRVVGDIGIAEDVAHDTLIKALESWPIRGIPNNPGAWLMTVAKRKAIDTLRRKKSLDQKYEQMAYQMNEHYEPDVIEHLDEDIKDNLLRLIFMTCHPILSKNARVALTLRLLGGLTTEEIANAFLVPEPTVAQRIVRAKRTLVAANVPFEVPQKSAYAERLSSVLEVIYLMFNEGYSASSGDNLIRMNLSNEALRMGRALAKLIHTEPEVYGLVALMEIQISRFKARTNTEGEMILLLDQTRSLWNQEHIKRGVNSLKKAEDSGGTLGIYALQASIAACHAIAETPEKTNWERISALYDALSEISPSPVVELNRAVAVSMVYGPLAGLEIVDSLLLEPELKNYHLLPSVKGNFLLKLGRKREAMEEFQRASLLTQNVQEQKLLLKQVRNCME